MENRKGEYHYIIKAYLWIAIILGSMVNFVNYDKVPEIGNLRLYFEIYCSLRVIALLIVVKYNKIGAYLFYLSVLLEIIAGFIIAPNYGFNPTNYFQTIGIAVFFSLVLFIKNDDKSGWNLLFEHKLK